MGHNHNHNHIGGTGTNYSRSFAIGIILNLVFIAIELFYGLIANSSALIADAGHNASDVFGLVFAWVAIWLADKKPQGIYTYGFKKSTILIPILNAVILFVAVGFILWDAVERFRNPSPVAGDQVMIVAGIGVVINTFTALMFVKGQKRDLNIRGAFLHMAADAIVSLGVVISGLLIQRTGANWIDPIMSIIIVLVIVWGTWRLFIDSIDLALDAAPKDINILDVSSALLSKSGVASIHDLHIWALSSSENALTVHIVSDSSDRESLLSDIRDLLTKEFNLTHTTVQVESIDGDYNCKKC